MRLFSGWQDDPANDLRFLFGVRFNEATRDGGRLKNSVAGVLDGGRLSNQVSNDPIPVRLSPELQKRVDDLCKDLALSRSAVLRMAVKQWLDATDTKAMNPLVQEGGSGRGSLYRLDQPAKTVYPKGRASKVSNNEKAPRKHRPKE